MNRNKVFVGYTIEGKRCLLYCLSVDPVYFYKDLENGKRYYEFEIYQESLVPIEQVIHFLKEYTSRWKIRKKYRSDAYQMISMDTIFVANLYQQRNIDVKEKQNHEENSIGTLVKLNCLVQKVDQSFFDLENGMEYKNLGDFSLGQFYIPTDENNLRFAMKDLNIMDTVMQKKKLLEKYNEQYCRWRGKK